MQAQDWLGAFPGSVRPHDPDPDTLPRPLARMREYRRPNSVAATAIGAAVTVVALLPVFLTSAMAVQITTDLAFGSAGLGLAVAAFRSGGAITSVFLGRLADRLGALRSIRLAAGIGIVTAVGIATTARGLWSLVAWLALGGSSLAMAQPGANRLLMAIVDPKRLGTAFGLKQSAPPIAAMLSGAAVPAVAVTIGWRWGFALAAVAGLALVASLNPPPAKERESGKAARASRTKLEDRGTILLLSLGFGLGTSTSSATTTFFVASAADAGSTPQFAGTMLAVASFFAIGSRILAGIISDRMVHGHLRMCAALLLTGSVGIAMLASGTETLMAVGAVIALVGVWGFNGVFWFALVRAYPDTPGRITGAVSPGGLLGSTLGPLFFGVMAERAGYSLSWSIVSGVALVAASVLMLGNQRLKRR